MFTDVEVRTGIWLERDRQREELMSHFKFDHLPEFLQGVSGEFFALAHSMQGLISFNSEEKLVGLRKLLEAKDCFVRAAILQEKEKVEEEP